MVGRQLVVPVGDQQQRPGPLHPPPQEDEQVEGGLVGPVGVLDHHHLGALAPVELVQEGVEQLLAGAARGQQGGQPAARLPAQVVQRPEGPGGEQRVAGPDQEPGLGRVPLGQLPDQHRLAHPGLAGQQHDPPPGGRPGQQAGQLVQQRFPFQQLHQGSRPSRW